MFAAVLPSRLLAQQSYLLVVSGLGGEERYRAAFHEWGVGLVKAAVEKYGVPRGNVVFLAEQPERTASWATGKATKDEIEKAVVSLAGKAGSGDQVFVVLIGHGSFQSGESRFNLPGPDPSAEDFATMLSAFRGPQVAFINTTSASGEFTKILSGPNRTIVTATKSGQERNESVFGKHFVEAYTGDGADTDKDGRVSLLEAFTYARLQVEREYREGNKLLTEHAVLDDDGDSTGTAEPDPVKGEGSLARAMFLGAPASAAPAGATPAIRALYEERRRIEQDVEQLRARKETMAEAEYERQLEDLLVALARKNEEIRKAEGRS